jgi:hypothetical protein
VLSDGVSLCIYRSDPRDDYRRWRLKERSMAIAILIGVVVALVISALMYRASAAAED